jgi:hypothetical protein
MGAGLAGSEATLGLAGWPGDWKGGMGGDCGSGPAHPANSSAAVRLILGAHCWSVCMALILLEALGALVLLVLIVWWTMFSGRSKGEPPPDDRPPDA